MTVIDSPDQAALRAVVRDLLAKATSVDGLDAVRADPAGYDRAIWRRLVGELGLAGLVVPERFGGAGATLAEAAVVLEELGRTLLPVPYLSTVVTSMLLGQAIEDAPEITEQYLGEIAAGAAIGAFAWSADVSLDSAGRLSGSANFVVDGPLADFFVVATADATYAVQAADALVVPVPTLDQTRTHATVSLASAPATRIGDRGLAVYADALMRTGLAVEATGAAREALDRTVDYLRTRVQFGAPIGSFQALQHRCADLAVAVESARATARAAVDAVARPGSPGAAQFELIAAVAKLHCGRVLRQVSGEMIQLHGGIGFTWEHGAHRYFTRAKATELLYGTPSELRTFIGRRAGLLGQQEPGRDLPAAVHGEVGAADVGC